MDTFSLLRRTGITVLAFAFAGCPSDPAPTGDAAVPGDTPTADPCGLRRWSLVRWALLTAGTLALAAAPSVAAAQDDAAVESREDAVESAGAMESAEASSAGEVLAEPASVPDETATDLGTETPRDDEFGIRATAEIGFTGVLAHEITLSTGGSRVDYVNDVAQSNLYLFLRVQVDVDVWRQHLITFLYQPLDITSTASAPRDLTIDGLVFPAGEPIQARYGFPFFRAGWAFDVLAGRDEELAFGLGLQLRNATIEFRSLDGERFRTRTDVGPVPLLRARGRVGFGGGWFFAFEADGWWSPIPGLNGTDNGLVEGAIADVSVRLGWRVLPHVDGFVSVRYLGGGADGTGDPTPTSDGFQANWLHFLNISLGATIDSRP